MSSTPPVLQTTDTTGIVLLYGPLINRKTYVSKWHNKRGVIMHDVIMSVNTPSKPYLHLQTNIQVYSHKTYQHTK